MASFPFSKPTTPLRLALFTFLFPVLLTACAQKWEYLVVSDGHVTFSYNTEPGAKTSQHKDTLMLEESLDAQKFLDVLGKDGWELVSIVGQIGGDQEFVFKRPLR